MSDMVSAVASLVRSALIPTTKRDEPPRTRHGYCYEYEPGVFDFPARCVRASGHEGEHRSVGHDGLAGVKWANERDAA